jgi:hypothetical protein
MKTKIMRLNDDIDIIYVKETGVIGDVNDLIKLLAAPHSNEYEFKVFDIMLCEDADPNIDVAFDKLCSGRYDKVDFDYIWERAEVPRW